MKKMIKHISKIVIIIMALFLVQNASAQSLQFVKPGQELHLAPINDTLWVMDNSRMVQVIETGKLYKLEKEKSELLMQKCDTLRAIITEKDSLVDIYAKDRKYYEEQLKISRNDAIAAGKEAKKFQRRARWATVGCGVAAGVGFVLGAVIFK
ncbi:MAG: hypothetical protein IKQ70_04375 [Bacteroidales bacterium]|nr:hypothetical protein [Bacteroidales bacterium]